MALIREHVVADVTLVDTVNDAIASFEFRQPDLIVAPTLLSVEDGDRLSDYVKWHADPHVQMVAISALDMLREAPAEQRQRHWFFRRRRPLSLGLQYDPSMVGSQIADALERAVTQREARGATLDVRPLIRQPEVPLPVELVRVAASATLGGAGALRERAERMRQRGPWVWAVRMPLDTPVELVNISSTGVLLESASKVSPGVTLELQLSGMGQHGVVMARFVRSEIAGVDRSGVRYYAAAQFAEPLAMLAPRAPARSRATPQSLAELFTTVVSESNSEEEASARFAHGLRGLIGARDVLIRATPIAPDDDCESIYFRVGGDYQEGMILQVLFDRPRALTTAEFRMLRAASGLASAVLELELASIHGGRLLPAPLAAGAQRLIA
jgi:CheY-like chemotaxis protein